jgi:hypothetical protein
MIAGLVSALLIIAAEPLMNRFPGEMARLIGEDYVGFFFGVAISAYFIFHERIRSIGRSVAFIAASTAAYLISKFTAVWLFGVFPSHNSMSSAKLDIPLPVFFGSGLVGSMLVFASALFIFRFGNLGWLSFRRAFLTSIGGGLLGVFGWMLGPLLGRPLLFLQQALRLPPSWETYEWAVNQQIPERFSLFIVWQSGVALLLGLILAREGEVLLTAPRSAPQSVGMLPASRRVLLLLAGLFFACILGFLSWQVFVSIRSERATARRLEAYKISVAEAPPVQNLSLQRIRRIPDRARCHDVLVFVFGNRLGIARAGRCTGR